MSSMPQQTISESYIPEFASWLRLNGYDVAVRKAGTRRLSYTKRDASRFYARGYVPRTGGHMIAVEGPAADEVVAFLDIKNGRGNGADLRPSYAQTMELEEMKVSLAMKGSKLCLRVHLPPTEALILTDGVQPTKPLKLSVSGELAKGSVTLRLDPFNGRAAHLIQNRFGTGITIYWPADELGGAVNATPLVAIPQENHWTFQSDGIGKKRLMIYHLPMALRQSAPKSGAPPKIATKAQEQPPVSALDMPAAPEVVAAVGSVEAPAATTAILAAPAVQETTDGGEIDFQALGELKDIVAMLNECRKRVPAARLTIGNDGELKVFIPAISL